MKKPLDLSAYPRWFLFAFAATAVASIALQNFIWAAVLFFLIVQIKNHQKFNWPTGPFAWATLFFLATFFTGAVLGIHPSQSFQTVHKYLTFLVLFFVAAMPLAVQDIRKLLLTLTYGAAFCALFGIGKHFFLHQDRIDSFSGDKMVFGGMLMVSFLIQFYFTYRAPRFWPHWTCLALISFGLLLTQTRGAWIGCAAGFALGAWFFNRKLLVGGSVAALVVFFLLPLPLQQRVTSIGNLENQERVPIWQAGWKISKDYPLWGIGQGNLNDIYLKYKEDRATEKEIPHLHDNYLQILVQNGWVGLAAYGLWIFTYYWSSLKWGGGKTETIELNQILLCVQTAVLVWGLTEYTFSHQFMNVQFFLLGLQVNLQKNLKPADPAKKAQSKNR